MNWLTMSAVGLMMELMLLVLGPLYFAFFLIFWVMYVPSLFLLSSFSHLTISILLVYKCQECSWMSPIWISTFYSSSTHTAANVTNQSNGHVLYVSYSWYSYNFILPVWNQVDTSKALAYGTKNHMRASVYLLLSPISPIMLYSLLHITH